MDYINKILCGNDLEILPKLPAESVSCVTTSPPYWGLRDYGIEPVIWDGDKDCKHDFSIETKAGDIRFRGKNSIVGSEKNPKVWEGNGKGNFCLRCNAWRGSLGLEPTFELYIKHLCDIFDEIKRVLRKDGTCFVNIGDSYWGGGQGGADYGGKEIVPESNFGHVAKGRNYLNKSLCDIPYRFSIGMINRGWIKRNTIIWYKKNCMPSSADDRFTIDFEYMFFFTKNNKAIFWTNEKTLECVDKQPPGTKGIEGEDWEWRPCPACSNKNYFNYRTWDVMKKEKGCPQFKASNKEKENIKNKICPRCKGLKKVKYSFWSGHDYWFEQQFEEHTTKDDLDRRKNKFWSENIADGGSGKQNKGRDRREFYGKQGRNKRCVWTDDSKYEIVVNKVNGENIFEAANVPQEEIIKCFGHWFSNKQNIKGTTWTIPTQPFPEAHFAVYPEELIEIPIKAGCPEFVCKKCGKARVKIYKDTGNLIGQGGYGSKTAVHIKASPTSSLLTKKVKEKEYKGYTDCGCNAGFEGGIVLDPFMGAGTTALVALKQRKRFIGIEIKQEYIDMANKRIARVQQRIF